MKNDTQIKVTCVTSDNQKDELHFDYFDKEDNMVGTVAVDETGRLGWSIWNSEYQANVLDSASYILGLPIENSLENILEAKEPNPLRWDRAQEYIEKRALLVNYKQNSYFVREFSNSSKR